MFTINNAVFVTKVVAQCYYNIKELIVKNEYISKVVCIKTTNGDLTKIET